MKSSIPHRSGFSALQRAEIAEITVLEFAADARRCFSALQRAEIAEIWAADVSDYAIVPVSVLFNEPKLLKLVARTADERLAACFSALQRAEIAEIVNEK